MCQRNDHRDQEISGKNQAFEIGQLGIVKNHAHNTYGPKYY